MTRSKVRFTPGAEADLLRLFDFLPEQDAATPLMCRRSLPDAAPESRWKKALLPEKARAYWLSGCLPAETRICPCGFPQSQRSCAGKRPNSRK
jgi:hypothetical protein